jgi:hypothetical protein
LRGREAGLDGGLVGLLAEVGEEVTAFLLAGVEDVPRRGVVDGVGDLLAAALEARAELFAEDSGAELRLQIHAGLQRERGRGRNPRRHGQAGSAFQTA